MKNEEWRMQNSMLYPMADFAFSFSISQFAFAKADAGNQLSKPDTFPRLVLPQPIRYTYQSLPTGGCSRQAAPTWMQALGGGVGSQSGWKAAGSTRSVVR